MVGEGSILAPEAGRARRAMLAHLRHELRTPLNAIIGYSEMLIEDAADGGLQDVIPDLVKIHTAGEQLLAQVNELLSASNLDAAEPELDLEALGATLRHELRTPLNAIIGYSELLIEDAQGAGAEGFVPDLEKIHAAGQRFLALVDDVVRFSEIQAGEVEADLTVLAASPETRSIVQEVMTAIRPLAADATWREAPEQGTVLVVDDNEVNRDLLARHLEHQGHAVALAENGRQALEMVGAQPFDLVLLDLMMPEMNGYEVLHRLKSDPAWRDIPVIMISALDEMDSIVRCIELGAEDYLPKPFNPVLLRARTNASLEKKRLRDQEVEYLRNVALVADAAVAVEGATFEPEDLTSVAAREDELGRLARVFQRMAQEVHLREQRLRRQLQQLRLDMEEMRGAPAEPLRAYLPMDRQQALARGVNLPPRTSGAALFADISGFTPLTAALAGELGLQRGAEELTRTVNQVYGALVAEVHRYGGSVIGFSGDAITCWLDETLPEAQGELANPCGQAPLAGGRGAPATASLQAGQRGAACALAMQNAMAQFASVTTPTGRPFSLAIKVAVVSGPVRRLLVGDPQIQVIEVIAGRTLDRLATAEHQAKQGEVLVEAEIVECAAGLFTIAGWRSDDQPDQRFAVVSELTAEVPPSSWPALPSGSLTSLQCRPWIPEEVYERARCGTSPFLSELRPVAALFLRFSGIDYDGDEDAGQKLDAFVRWVQTVLRRQGGVLFQVTMGDKGSNLLAGFGTPVAHNDDEARAVYAALELRSPPPHLAFVSDVRIGIAQGQMRTGQCGSSTRHIYTIQGDRANLAARLMMAATDRVLCDEGVYQAARTRLDFEALPPLAVKGRAEPLAVFRPLPTSLQSAISSRIDRLSPNEQLTLKVASVIGPTFGLDVLYDIFPPDAERARLREDLRALERLDLIAEVPADEAAAPGPDQAQPPAASRLEAGTGSLGPQPTPSWRLKTPSGTSGQTYFFRDLMVHETVYGSMLYAQRRHLHRQVAEWYERACADDPSPPYELLAHHWRGADEAQKALDCLEKAGQQALKDGAYLGAERLLQESLELEAGSAVLSDRYHAGAAPDFEAARRYALERLQGELAPKLCYHSLLHTRDDVLPAALGLARMLGLGEEETRLLEIGALYHDIGFVVQHDEHERAGAEIAAQVLPRFGFGPEQVAAIQGMIMATRLPQSPHTLLEEILADADLDNLGREDGLALSQALRAEFAARGTPLSEEEWLQRQVRFLRSHRYFTEAAQSLRGPGKQKNIARMEERLAVLLARGEDGDPPPGEPGAVSPRARGKERKRDRREVQ